MTTRADEATAQGRLLDLVDQIDRQEGFAEVVSSLAEGDAATLDGVWGGSLALVAAALAHRVPATLLVVCPFPDQVDELLDELALFTPHTAERFPAWETMPEEWVAHDTTFGDRLRILKRLGGSDPPRLVVASVQSLLQPVPPAGSLRAHSRSLRVGEALDIDELARWMVESGFHGTSAVELPGEFSRRGGIVDIFAPDWQAPVRVELFGDQVESLRRFDVATQRSLASLEAVEVTMLDPSGRHRAHLSDFVPPASWWLLSEPEAFREEGINYLRRIDHPEKVHHVDSVLEQIVRFPTVTASAVAAGSLETTCRLKIESVERFSGEIGKVRAELDGVGMNQEVFLVCPTEAEAQRLAEVFAETRLTREGRLHFPIGHLHHGFRLVPAGIVLVGSGELFRREDLRRPGPRRLTRALDSFLDLREGDLVVHVAHGIARYRGMEVLEKGRQVEEHLVLEFAEGTKLYVPSSKIGLVQKYVGGTKSRPALAKLGGNLWQRRKRAVQEAVTDLAVEMLEVQAARAAQRGIAFRHDTEWQQEFDAAFPYEETGDQLAAIAAIKEDMQRSRPMDRLLCGDVGYGKTEVAMRAAFKAVDAGYQVAMLVPTTVLAEQHYRTFSGRMASFPFEIAVLSRFANRKQQAEIIERLAEGSVDIVIGTHRLVQPDVRFQNLGMVIIDEEQRFGVEIKERLKSIRTLVDVLTTTATPIPRTLHMALTGLRDISNLETPPADRLAVETRVTRFDPELIRHAVLRELSRGGQIFFVHNRVEDIEIVARKLRDIVPEASLRIGHAQMPEGQLEKVMVDFVHHRFDLLLATTIVESGLDIPNANTMFIDEADRYGLADLHQLRGRVGRYKHRAYCYLLVDQNKHLTPNAARRLKAIEEFSQMGAGFALALRDLEIRGAGNILGTQQSGHIALVGYELYCQLLEDAVRRLQHLPPRTSVDVDVDLPGEAYLPRGYVSDMRQKIDLYRRLGRVATREELADLLAEMADRFGPLPEPVRWLAALAELRFEAHAWGVRSIHLEDGYAVFAYTNDRAIRQLATQSGGRLRVVDARTAYLPLRRGTDDAQAVFAEVKSLLRPR